MIKLSRRKSLVNLLIFVGFIWFILIVLYSSESPRRSSIEVLKFDKVVKSKSKEEESEPPVFDDFEDNFADSPVTSKLARKKKQKVTRSHLEEISQNLDPPPVSQDILDLLKRLNLSKPGHMGKPVVLPSNLPGDIQEKINKSWEIYSINEFVSNLIPLYRELPDIRPDYCKTVKYSSNLPVTSVILIFHNEPFTMIMRSVFAIFKRTPPELLGEIVLVDDCSDRGDKEIYFIVTFLSISFTSRSIEETS